MLIAQLSDLHVRPKGQLYRDVIDSNETLRQAIAHLQNLDLPPDLVLFTGDLVDEGLPEDYTMLREILAGLAIPYFVMPGNHDHRENLRAAFADQTYLPKSGALHYVIEHFPVRVLALDCSVNRRHHGDIESDGLRWLETTLEAQPSKPTLIALHHPPMVSGIAYLDEYRYLDSARLEAVISKFSNVEAVICGHVHRTMIRRWAGTVLVACPSTATEIALQLDPKARPKSYLGPRACMLHFWQEGQGLVSHLSFIGTYPGPYPFF